jgi:hypothetical protein
VSPPLPAISYSKTAALLERSARVRAVS